MTSRLTGAQWLAARERAAATRASQHPNRRRTDRLPRLTVRDCTEDPCRMPLHRGHCCLPGDHPGGCLPAPACYPPMPTSIRSVS